MRKHKKTILVALIVLIICLFILPMSLIMILYNRIFAVRVTTDNDFYDFIHNIYPDFERRKTSFKSNKGQVLTGYFYGYFNKNIKGLIVVAHGIGDGHNNYVTEIEAFARNGYLVFAYDGTGSNESEGDKLIGLSQAPIDLKYALDYIDTIKELKNLPLILYGHSWGGFAVSTVSNYHINNNIAAIVSVSGFERNRNVISDLGKAYVGDCINLFIPFVNLYERILFGSNSKYSGSSGLAKTDAKVLIIHSVNDELVDYEMNFMKYKELFGKKDNFTFVSLNENGHNALLQTEANKKIKNIITVMKKLDKNSQEYKNLVNEEYKLILQLDQSVVDTIIKFFDETSLDTKKFNYVETTKNPFQN